MHDIGSSEANMPWDLLSSIAYRRRCLFQVLLAMTAGLSPPPLQDVGPKFALFGVSWTNHER